MLKKSRSMWLNDTEETLVIEGNICLRKQMGPEVALGQSKKGKALRLGGNRIYQESG